MNFKSNQLYSIDEMPEDVNQAMIDVGDGQLVMGVRDGSYDDPNLWVFPVVVDELIGISNNGEEVWEKYFETQQGYPEFWSPILEVKS